MNDEWRAAIFLFLPLWVAIAMSFGCIYWYRWWDSAGQYVRETRKGRSPVAVTRTDGVNWHLEDVDWPLYDADRRSRVADGDL